MSRRKILVVDDNAVILKTLSLKLSASGFEVLTAEDGAGAVRIARQNQPDLIVLDINFPPDVAHGGGVPWDGFLIMDWLKRLEEARQIPVIIITGGEDAQTKARAQASGAVSFFQKPIDHHALVVAICNALGEPCPALPPAAPTPEPAKAKPSTWKSLFPRRGLV